MLHTWSYSEAASVTDTGTAKYLIHGVHLTLLLGLAPNQDEVIPLHLSTIPGFLSKVLITVSIPIRSLCRGLSNPGSPGRWLSSHPWRYLKERQMWC